MTKFITQTDLKNWSEKDCQIYLPELVRRLIQVTGRDFSNFCLPTVDGTALSGWDGIVDCSNKIHTIDTGLSLWEIGSDANPCKKANKDYNKRSGNPLGYNPKNATFVFVTNKIWKSANRWALEKRSTGVWKNIVVYTAIELENWIAQYPSVGLWLADHLGILKEVDVETPEMYWHRWSSGNGVTLKPSIIFGGRECAMQSIKECCHTPHILNIQAYSREEAFAFIVACMVNEQSFNCIVAYKRETVQKLLNHYSNIVIITFATGSWEYATRNGNSVVVASCFEDQINNAIKLPAIKRDSFIDSLVQSEINQSFASRLATITGRNVMTLRRELNIDSCKPKWLLPEWIDIFVPAILIGRWNSSNPNDRNLLELLSGRPYVEFENDLQKFQQINDSPLLYLDNNWIIQSESEAIKYCKCYLSRKYLGLFDKVVNYVIKDSDPEIDKVFGSPFFIRHSWPKYSNLLKQGIFTTLIFLSLEKETSSFVQQVLDRELKSANLNQLLSLEPFYTLLAEAAPETFIEIVEQDFDNGRPLLSKLFDCTTDWNILGTDGRFHRLLFALEAIAWNEKNMMSVADILLRLFSFTVPSNNAHTPIECFKHIFRYFLPQTFVKCDFRLKIHEQLCKRYPDSAYMISLLVVQSLTDSVFSPSNSFIWRDYGQQPLEEGQRMPTYQQVECMVLRALSYCVYSTKQVCELIKLSSSAMLIPWRDAILSGILNNTKKLIGDNEICDTLRQTIAADFRQKKMDASNNSGALSYQKLLDTLSSKDVIAKHVWLFEKYWINVPVNGEWNFEKEESIRHNLRKNAIEEVLEKKGAAGIFLLAEQVVDQHCLGNTLGKFDSQNNLSAIIEYLNQKSSLHKFFAGYLWGAFYNEGIGKCLQVVKRINNQIDQARVMADLMYEPIVGSYIDTLSKAAQNEYWKNAILGLSSDLENVIIHLNEVGRINTSIEYIALSYRHPEYVVNDELILDTIMLFWQCGTKDLDSVTGYHICEIIKHLDNSTSPKVHDLIFTVELFFYRLFRSHDVDTTNLRIGKDLLHKSDVMMQFLDIYARHDDDTEALAVIQRRMNNSEDNARYKIVSDVLQDLKGIPCADENGRIDYCTLKTYITNLQSWGKEHRKIVSTNRFIGQLLAHIPISDDSVDENLCELFEDINSEEADRAYETQIFNMRGVVTKGVYQGGNSEYLLEKKYADIAKKTIAYRHITNIYNSLSLQYHNMGISEDHNAELRQLSF